MAAFPLPARTSSLPTLSSSTQAPSRDAGMSLVNLAARQRMLSQRMVLQTVLAARGSDLHLKAARSSLTLFTDSQARLVDTPRHLDATSAELKATYQEIKDYVLKEFGLKVSSLYISQVKRKCGIEVGENYNLPKSENARVPQCPKEKEDAIKAALKYYAMI